MDKYAKLDLLIRTGLRTYWAAKAPKKSLLLPGFEIPRLGNVELHVGPKGGTTIGLVLRCDYVTAYKHAVGQMVGALAHYHRMKERELKEAVTASVAHPDMLELKQGTVDPLKVAKQLYADQQAGKVTLVLATDVPDVPQQARELEANFFPIAEVLEICLTAPVNKRQLCQAVDFVAVTPGDPPRAAPLHQALKPLLGLSG